MQKKAICLLLFLLYSFFSFAQDFSGISTGNYAGVTGVLLQPASIVDSRFKFDVNLFSSDINYSNNYFLLNRDILLKFNKDNFKDYQTFKNKYLSQTALPAGDKVFFNINNRTQLPLSFMATLSEKSAMSFSVQSRSMIQGRNLSQDLANIAYNGFYYDPLNNRPIDVPNFSINSLSWVEAGLNYGRVLYSSKKHFLKVAFTAKYLAGIASLNIGSTDFRLSVNSDSSINFNTSNFRYDHNKNSDFGTLFDKSFRPDATSFGFDAGVVYEYRGNLNHFNYIRNDDEKSYLADRRDVNKYIFKLGASLLDAGMFTFDKPANVNSFSANVANWNIRNAHYSTISQFDTALANRVVANLNDPRQYNIYLPTALSVQLDVRFVKGLYLNAMAYRPVKLGRSAGTRFDSYGYYTITPRWETRHLGIYIPYTFVDKSTITDYKQNMLGATVRVGPLFIGSSNLGTMAFNRTLKAADFHIGLKVGYTYGKPTKATRFFDRLRNTSSSNKLPADTIAPYYAHTDNPTNLPANNLVVDYAKGRIYNNGNKDESIIIINNNYYYAPNNGITRDSVAQGYSYPGPVQDTIARMQDSINFMRSNDSAKQVLKDNISQKREKLDSLINQLQLLRNQMDSTRRKDSAARQSSLKSFKDPLLLENKNAALQYGNTQSNLMYEDSIQYYIALRQDRKRYAALPKDSIAAVNRYIDLAALNKKKSYNNSDTLVIRNEAQNYATPQNSYNNIDAQKQYRQTEKQNEIYTRTMRQSNQLQSEINSLQYRLNRRAYVAPRYTRSNEVISVPYAAASYLPAPDLAYSPVYNSGYFPAQQQKIIRDTVYIRDTVHVKDPVDLAKNNAALKNLPVTEPVVRIPAEKTLTETIIKKMPKTALPENIILFDAGKTTIKPAYTKALGLTAATLKANLSFTATIAGYTDNTGPAITNKILSLKRANAIEIYLVGKGVNEAQMKIAPLSNKQPSSKEIMAKANPKDRKVVVRINW